MPSFHLRFVGHTVLPKSLSELDVEQGFGLSDKDVAAIHEKYKSKPDSRLGVAIQLSLLRATGRTPETVAGLPPALLRHLSKQVGARTTDLASLKTLYNRRATRFNHQAWAREFAGFSEHDEVSKNRLSEVLGELAISALSTDDLVQQAQLWLFAQQIIIPGDRPIRDLARIAFAAQDAASLAAVRAGVPERELKVAMSRLYAKRLGRTGGTVLEWLKTPPGKHGQISLSDIIKKVQYLQTLRVHECKLAAIPIARLEAYSHAVVSRPPSDTAKLSDDQRTLELCCFLYVTLLELTDISIDMGGRRVCDVVRAASGRVVERQARGSIDLRAQRPEVKNVLYDARLTDKARIAKLKELLPKDENERAGSRAALVRQSMVDDWGPKVAALVNAMGMFEFLGSEKARSIKQIAALRELAAAKARQLPDDFDLSIADPVWHPLLSSPDRKKALAALRACTISTVRKDVRGGKVWLAHSRKYRDREDQLIPADEWENKRKAFMGSSCWSCVLGR